jgi:hypothetical protein
MASSAPVSDALNSSSNASLVLPSTNAEAALSLPTSSTSAAEANSATGALTQQLTPVFDALASAGLNVAIDDTLLAPPTAQAAGAFSIFMDQLFVALATQQTQAAQTAAAQPNTDDAAAASPGTTATPQPAAAAEASAAFAGNSPSAGPNSALEGEVQALASELQSTNAGTTAAAATSVAPSALQQTFDDLVASVGGNASPATLPAFLQALANNLHTSQSSLGNLFNSQT